MRSLFRFPNPVNEFAARSVAAGVVVLCLLTLIYRTEWLLWTLAYGFLARVATGPTLSPLGQLATRVVAPRLGTPRLVPGPPKRFAQAIGATFTVAALVAWYTGGPLVSWVLVGVIMVFAVLESALGFCMGCTVFGALQRLGVIPESVCDACANVRLRHPVLEPSR
ncbi:MAG: DUF4395 domain-containing protein [Jatrophihabitans sp.]